MRRRRSSRGSPAIRSRLELEGGEDGRERVLQVVDEHAQEPLPVVVGELAEALLLGEGPQLLGEALVEAGGADGEGELVGDERQEPGSSAGNVRGSANVRPRPRDDLVRRRRRGG